LLKKKINNLKKPFFLTVKQEKKIKKLEEKKIKKKEKEKL
jgi:hypothetical protein